MNSQKQIKAIKIKNNASSSGTEEELIEERFFHLNTPVANIHFDGTELSVSTNPQWNYTSPSGTFKVEIVLINENILLARKKGVMKPADTDITYNLLKSIIKNQPQDQFHYIDHVAKLEPLARETRKKISKFHIELKNYWIQMYQILPVKNKVAYVLFKDLHQEKIIFTNSIKETLSHCLGGLLPQLSLKPESIDQKPAILDLQKAKKPVLIENIIQLREEKKQLNEYFQHRIDYITKVVGLCLWNDDFIVQQPILNQNDCFSKLYDAISLLLYDIKDGLSQKNTLKYLLDNLDQTDSDKLQVIFSNIRDVVYLINPEGIVTYISPSVLQNLGYNPTEIIGKSIFRFIHPEDTSNFLSSVHTNFFLRNQQKIDYRMLKKNASYVWLEAFSSAIYDEDGKMEAVTVTTRESTDKRQLQDNLNNREEELRSTMEAMSESVYVFDNDGVLLTSNQKKNKDHFIDHDIEDLLGKTYFEIFSESFSKRLTKTIRIVYASGLKHEFEYIAENSVDGKDHDVYKICLLARRNNISNFAGITMIARNITAEKKLKEQNNELEKTNEELDQFVYSASHDLRAPLASTLGLINVSRITENVQEKMKYLDLMEASLQKMDRYIHDITDYSRNARQTIECERIEFSELIEDVKQSLSYHENAAKIDFLVFIDMATPFYTDYSRLNIILRNILSNSIKYHDLTRSHPYVSIDVKTSESEVIIVLEDNGIGIDARYLDKIFDMFYQAAPEAFGSGLGLYIVKEAVHKLRGNIQVKSTLKQGTIFTVFLPNQSQKEIDTP